MSERELKARERAQTASVDALSNLQAAVSEHILAMDKAMRDPSTYQRGVKVGKLVAALERKWCESMDPPNKELDAVQSEKGA